MQAFKDFIKDNIILFDGAMGTYIYQKGIFIDKCYDALNLSQPELIQSIHQEYLQAGAMVLESNTWGANRFKLQKHNLSDQVKEINARGVELAREVAGDKGYVAGSIGPLGVKLKPWGDVTAAEAQEAFREQCSVLCENQIDLFIFETFHDITELELAIQTAQEFCDLPIVAMFVVDEDGKTPYDVPIEETVHRLSSLKIDAIGMNCMVGPKLMLDFVERIRPYTQLPIAVMPNAGLPQDVDGRKIYMSTAEYFSVYARRFIDAGASILGGCCGTTPEHIKKMAGAIAMKQTRMQRNIQISEPQFKKADLPEPVPLAQKSNIARKLAEGQSVSMVEMVPPRGRDLSKHFKGAELLKEAGVDAINIPDGPRASSRVNGMALSVVLQNEMDIEVILHYTCRDRNLLGMQSDLLGASILGVNNILAITGDPPMMGDYPEATAVFDIDSIGLVHLIHQLNHGIDIGNKPIGEPTAFCVGVGVDPNAVNLEKEISRLRQKVSAGAEYVITQPVFDVVAFESFLEKIPDISIPIIAGVWPLVSLRNAEFMKHEVPGVVVPDVLIDRIAKFDTKEDQLKVGIEIAQEMSGRLKSSTSGIQASAPFGRYQLAVDVLGAF